MIAYFFIGFMVWFCRYCAFAGNNESSAASVAKAVFWPALLVVFLGKGVAEWIS